MALSEDEVRKIALLARLELQPQEVAEMAGQLGKIVDFVAQLDALNTDGVEPLVHAIELENVLVDDQVRTGLDRQAALSNSPAHDDECFRVPAVL